MNYFKPERENFPYYLLKSILGSGIRFLLLFLVTIQLPAGSLYAQNPVINLSLQQVTVEQVLDRIEKDTDFTFLYTDKSVDTNRKVDMEIRTEDIREILDRLFKGTNVKYRFVDRQIILSTKQETGEVNRSGWLTGVIKEVNGEPVIGAGIMEKGTTRGTTSDAAGKFSFYAAPGATLVITYMGYISQEIQVNGRHSFSIILKEDSKILDEVVVVGYGSMKKKDLTGAVAAVSGDDLASRKTTQLSTALQGTIAGVTITRDNNAPGAVAGSIKVRGVTTIGDTSPLVIVDGVPGNINDVNPNDVESISVLKDAASASIYGSRAAAGVILITTRRAGEKDLSIHYNFEFGLEIPTKQPGYVGVRRFLETTNELRYNDNKSGGWNQAYSGEDVDNWEKYHRTNPDKYPVTDWVGLILKGSAPRQTHTISVAGGSRAVRSNVSFIYDKVDGLYADRYYERFTFRANNDFTVNNYLGATLDFNFKRTKNHQPYYSPFSEMRMAPMIYPAVWANGGYAAGKNGANPYATVNSGGFRDEWYNQAGGRAAVHITPVDGLKISAVIAPD